MKQEKRLQTIDGESLMNLPLQPLRFVVDSLLSQGLHVLAGSPKVGKSWLALWLSVVVAKGESVWGMETQQRRTNASTGRKRKRIHGTSKRGMRKRPFFAL